MISYLLPILFFNVCIFVNGWSEEISIGSRYKQCNTDTDCGPIPQMGCVTQNDSKAPTNFCAPVWNLQKTCHFDWMCPAGYSCRKYPKKTQRLLGKLKVCRWIWKIFG
eukprot:08096.XXX_219940_220381_1 [CDS] Oithona nana genome sequencing.